MQHPIVPRRHLLTFTVLSLSLAACYQATWKADYASPVVGSRNYSVTSKADNTGNLLVGGATTVAITQNDNGDEIVSFQPTLLKYDSAGKLLWNFSFDNGKRRTTPAAASEAYLTYYTGGPEFSHITVDAQNNIYAAGVVAGNQFATDENDYDVAVFKLTPNGQVIWQRTFEVPTQDSPLTLSLSRAGNLLLGIGHSQFVESSAVEALSLSSESGTTLWQHSHQDDNNRTFLYGYAETTSAKPVAASSPDRVVLGSSGEEVFVYSESGELLYTLNEPASTTQHSPDRIIPACSGDSARVKIPVAASVIDTDVVVAYSDSIFFCTGGFASLEVARYDESGHSRWTTPVQIGNYEEDVENWEEFRKPFSIPYLFTDGILKSHGSQVFLSTSAIMQHFTAATGNYPVVDVDQFVVAFNELGETQWQQRFGTAPIVEGESEFPREIAGTWFTGGDITITAQGKPVITMNEVSVSGRLNYSYTVRDMEMVGVTSQLVEFNPDTGAKDLFAKEIGQVARSVEAHPGKGVFKVADTHTHVPGWWYTNPTGVTSAPSSIHTGMYQPR